jgi:hypothetical protein
VLYQDDGKRPKDALAISISRVDGGQLRIMFDNLQLIHEGDFDRLWRHSTFVTSAGVDERRLEEYSFSQEELEGLANLILGMLKVALDHRT